MDVKAEAAPEAIEAAMDAPTDATEAELARADADVPRRQLSLDLIRTFMRINSVRLVPASCSFMARRLVRWSGGVADSYPLQNYYKKRGLGPDGAAPSAAKRALAKAGGGKQQASVDHYAFAVNGDELFHNGRYRSSGKRMGMVRRLRIFLGGGGGGGAKEMELNGRVVVNRGPSASWQRPWTRRREGRSPSRSSRPTSASRSTRRWRSRCSRCCRRRAAAPPSTSVRRVGLARWKKRIVQKLTRHFAQTNSATARLLHARRAPVPRV